MTELFSAYNVIISILVGILLLFIYILRNLLIKVEKYEDVTVEVGYFFDKLKEIQKELDTYMLPENYGKEEKQG